MSLLTLVRHSQASFLADDYDQLSDTGHTQARLLGEYWARRELVFDEVYTGPRARQRQTAELAAASYCRKRGDWPEPVILEELDEYDLGGILRRLAPALVQQEVEFATLVEHYRTSEQDRARSFQRMFEVLLRHWMATAAVIDGVETWQAFRERVQGGLRRILGRPGQGRRVAVFTSGGFIGTAVQQALAAPDRTALELSWRLRNCSLTEFVFSGDRCSLDSFNAVPHLDDPTLWTYR